MDRKTRVPIPEELAATVLFESDHTCCKCRVSGRAVQIHHIDEDPANNEILNLAVLCLECHNDTEIRGGFGRRLSAGEVTQYRDDWHRRVLKRRDHADALAAASMAEVRPPQTQSEPAMSAPVKLHETRDQLAVREFVTLLPKLRWQAYLALEGQTTPAETVLALHDVVAVLSAALTTLLSYYPPRHFGGEPAHYVSAMAAERTHWHYLRTHDQGIGVGSLNQVYTVMGVAGDIERMIRDTVGTLLGWDVREPDEFDLRWQREWDRSDASS